MRSLPEASREETVVTEGNCYGKPCHNWLCCLLSGFRQAGIRCRGFISPWHDIRRGQLVLASSAAAERGLEADVAPVICSSRWKCHKAMGHRLIGRYRTIGVIAGKCAGPRECI